MNKHTKTPAHIQPRPGEGHNVDVSHQTILQPNGTSVSLVGLNLAQAPVPDRRYAADLAWVLYKYDVVKLIFAQETIGTKPTLRSMLVVNLTPHAVKQFLQKLASMDPLDLDKIASISGIQAEPLFEVKTEPEQTIAFAANMIAAAIVGRETCLDFYQASAFAMAHINSVNKVPVDPVVRVDMRTSLLLSIRNAIKQLEKEFPPEINYEEYSL